MKITLEDKLALQKWLTENNIPKEDWENYSVVHQDEIQVCSAFERFIINYFPDFIWKFYLKTFIKE